MRHGYLSHIDILRALAVLLVIFNHLELPYFTGGFIGVDIFLVISGYLITRNINIEKKITSTFSFKKFYQRRVIRLAPAFFTLIVSCYFIFYFILTPNEWTNFLTTLISSVTLTSNIYYWTLLNDYFSIDAKSTPLLHIWSLSLEEQFYLIWPFILLHLLKFKNKLKLILYIILISIIISYTLTASNPIAAYYLLPSRIFEFCIGGFIALLPSKTFSKKISYIFTLISLAIILSANILINKKTIFPSYIALIPCIGAGIFIYFSAIIGEIKPLNSLKYIGKISYPMYLWHFPIIVYLHICSITLNFFTYISIIFLIISLSYITHEKIEKKVNIYTTNQPNIIKKIFIFPSLMIILISLLNLNYLKKNQKDTFENSIRSSIKCIDKNSHPIQECLFGNLTQKETSVLLLGDSHANAQHGFVDILTKDANLKGYEITYSSTAFLPHIERFIYLTDHKKIKHISSFKSINDSNIQRIQNGHFKYVILGGFFPHNAERNIYTTSVIENTDIIESHSIFITGIENALDIIIKSGATPVIINDNPILRDVDINCNLRSKSPQEKCFFDRRQHNLDFKNWMYDLNFLKAKYKKLIVLDFTSIICSQEVCYSYLNNVPLYRDKQHLTYTGSKEIGVQYLEKYGNPLKSHEK